MKTLHIKVSKLCERLFKLERQGRYEEALSEVSDLWRDPKTLPDTDGLPPRLAAELVLRCGSLYGFFGHNEQIPESQEISRNLLNIAEKTFSEQSDFEKVAECENYLALTYWRTGEINEAKIWLAAAFAHDLKKSHKTRIYSHIIEGLVLFSAHEYREILDLFLPLESDVQTCADFTLKGAFYNLIGNCWENLDNDLEALENLERAKNYYQSANHQVYYGVILNDLAFLQKSRADYASAHQFIDTATKTFRKIKDRSREGYSLDTKACIYFSEGKNKEALETIEIAAAILSAGENFTFQVETFRTKIKILISMDEISLATFCLIEAVETAKTKISEAAAENLVKDYENCLRERLSLSSKPSAANVEDIVETETSDDLSLDNLELVLPSPLSNFEDIQGLWINNSHLEEIGIMKNSLAVIVPTDDVKRGDLIAIEEIENNSVSCGFYDNEFGIVCLEGYDGEPLLFDEEKIRIVGKIVGVANDKTADGKLIVEPI